MNRSLSDLLKNVSTEMPDRAFNYVDSLNTEGKYYITPEKKEIFWDEYCYLASTSKEKMTLAEKYTEIRPFRFKLVFSFSDGEDPFNEKFNLSVISIIQQVISEILQIRSDKKELSCVLLEYSNSWIDIVDDERKQPKRGIILHFPYCKIDNHTAKELIVPKILDELREKKVVFFLSRNPINDLNSAVDMEVYKEAMPLYLSAEGAFEPIPTVSKFYKEVFWSFIHEEDSDYDPSVEELGEIFSPELHEDCRKGLISEQIIKSKEDLYYWFPLFLSSGYYDSITKIRDQSVNESLKATEPLSIKDREKSDGPMEMIKVFLSLLPTEFFEEKHYWVHIGCAYHKATNGEKDGLDEWIKYTSQLENENITTDLCEELYPNLYQSQVTLKTLAWYAKEENPEGYKRWHDKWVLNSLEDALSCDHSDVGKAFYRCNWLNNIYALSADGGKSRWFKFAGHRWASMDQGLDLKSNMSDDSNRGGFLKRFIDLRKVYDEQISQSNDKNEKALIENKIKRCTTLISKLKNQGYKQNILKEAQEFFRNDHFFTILNDNDTLIGHNNAVSEVCDDKIIFRKGKPEDYISKNTWTNYVSSMNDKHPQVIFIKKWIRQIFYHDDMVDCMNKLLSSILLGGNNDKLLPGLTGNGNNSKSMLIKLIESTFGDYLCKMPSSTFTSTKNSGGPSPELDQARNVRMAIVDELEEDEIIRAGQVKRFTGNDSTYSRACFQNGGKMKSNFKLWFVFNKPPNFNSIEKSIQDRFLLVPCDSKWLNADLITIKDPITEEIRLMTEDEQFKNRTFLRDNFFDAKIVNYKSAFLWVLAQGFTAYKNEGIQRPESCQNMNLNYWEGCNRYNSFTTEFIENVYKIGPNGQKEIDSSYSVKCSELFKSFKTFWKANFEGDKVPTADTFKYNVSMILLGKSSNAKVYKGVRMRETLADLKDE